MTGPDPLADVDLTTFAAHDQLAAMDILQLAGVAEFLQMSRDSYASGALRMVKNESLTRKHVQAVNRRSSDG